MQKNNSYKRDQYCTNCKSIGQIVKDDYQGRRTCTQCGCVAEQRFLDPTAEYNNYRQEQKRTSNDPKRADQKYDPTKLDGGCGLQLPGSKADAQKYANLLNTSIDRRLQNGRQVITEMCERIDLKASIKNEAIKIYNDIALKCESFKGKNKNAICAAILYMAGRIMNSPIQLQQISVQTGVNEKQLKYAYKTYKWYVPELKYIQASTYVQKFSSNLKIKCRKQCNQLVQKILKEGDLDGRNPRTIAAVTIFIITQLDTGETISLKDISGASSISEGAIKNSLKKIKHKLYSIIPKWKNRLKIESLYSTYEI